MGTSGRISHGACRLLVLSLLAFTSVLPAPSDAGAEKDRSAPTTPTNLRVTGTTASSVSLAWNASADKGGVTRLRYIVVDSRGFGTLVWHPQTTVSITSLTPGSTYSFRVYAEDESWNRSGDSNAVTATLPRDTSAPSPPVLSATAVNPSEVWLSWTASTDDIPFGLAGYQVRVDGAAPSSLWWLSERQAVVRHLTRATTYRFTVEARDRSGNVATSNTLAVTTQASTDTQAPTAPSSLRAISEHGDCEVVLGWDQSVDDVDPQSSVRYEIFLDGVLNDIAIGVGSMLTYGFRGPTPSTFTMRAVDRSGNTSAPSTALTSAISGC